MDKNLSANVNARKAVWEFFTFAKDAMKTTAERERCKIDEDRFWERVAEEAAAKVGKRLVPDSSEPEMDQATAMAFEQTVLEHGKWKGLKVNEVAPRHWLCVFESPFNRLMGRYIRSRRFQQRIEKED